MRILVVALLAACFSVPLRAQTYPVKPVRMIVSYPAGGPTDVVARLLAEGLGENLKQPFVIENRPGASGIIGNATVAKAPPDGYTLLFTVDTTLTVTPLTNPNTPFDPVEDFAPISMVLSTVQGLVVNATVPAANVEELFALAKKQPLTYVSGGVASPGHLAMLMLSLEAGLQTTHIAYKGIGQALPAVVNGDVPMLITPTQLVWPLVRSGRLRLLGLMGEKRSPKAPEVPTLLELGYKSAQNTIGNYILLAPAATPGPILEQLHKELGKVLAMPAVAARLEAMEVSPLNDSPAETAARMKRDLAQWRSLIDRLQLKVE
jgi:tripartite-type tricarboxylate transporter receptor subunit TctC